MPSLEPIPPAVILERILSEGESESTDITLLSSSLNELVGKQKAAFHAE